MYACDGSQDPRAPRAGPQDSRNPRADPQDSRAPRARSQDSRTQEAGSLDSRAPRLLLMSPELKDLVLRIPEVGGGREQAEGRRIITNRSFDPLSALFRPVRYSIRRSSIRTLQTARISRRARTQG